jgi:hypothetical protein
MPGHQVGQGAVRLRLQAGCVKAVEGRLAILEDRPGRHDLPRLLENSRRHQPGIALDCLGHQANSRLQVADDLGPRLLRAVLVRRLA